MNNIDVVSNAHIACGVATASLILNALLARIYLPLMRQKAPRSSASAMNAVFLKMINKIKTKPAVADQQLVVLGDNKVWR